ncbi:hypothetical protein FKM82_009280 [Ascaphus truei]
MLRAQMRILASPNVSPELHALGLVSVSSSLLPRPPSPLKNLGSDPFLPALGDLFPVNPSTYDLRNRLPNSDR